MGTSDEIKLSVGVLQVDTLASYLFDIVIDYILRKTTEKQALGNTLNGAKGTTSRTTRQDFYLTDLDYADDIALLSSSFKDAQNLLTRVEEEALKVGIKINIDKTEYIKEVSGKRRNRRRRSLEELPRNLHRN
jgi:subtilase family serine protease